MQLTAGELYQVTSSAIDQLERKYPPFLFVVKVEEVDHSRDSVSFNLVRAENQRALHDLRCLVEGHREPVVTDDVTGTRMKLEQFERESAFLYWIDKGAAQLFR